MTMLVMEAFDGYADSTDFRRRWAATQTTAITPTTGRLGGRAVRLGSVTIFSVLGFGVPVSGVVGFALKFGGTTLTAQDICSVMSGTGEQLILRCLASGALQLDRGSTNIDTTTAAMKLGSWHYIEFKFVISNTGSYEVKFDGVSVMSDAGPVDTQNGSLASFDAIQFDGNGGNLTEVDDLYLLDLLGTTNNDFLGDVLIETMLPDADGNRNDFTQLSGLTNYEMVDDGNTPDDDTTYNSGSVVGNDELYGMAAMAGTFDTVYAVQVRNHVRKESAGSRIGRALVRSNTDELEGGDHPMSTSYRYYDHIYETDPQGAGAWTETRINAAEFGFTIFS